MPPTPPQTTRFVASTGDLVCGLVTPSPPQPFVGTLGNPADDAAATLIAPLLTAAGLAPPRRVDVRIRGRKAANLTTPATSHVGGIRSQTIGGSYIARLDGQSFTCHQDPSQVGPTSAIMVIGGQQGLLRVGGPNQATGSSDGNGSSKAGPSASQPRAGFGSASPELVALSTCSPQRLRDLAPPNTAVLVGDPVNVATGAVVTSATDFAMTAPPFAFVRQYASNRSSRIGGFGPGWSHCFEQSVWLEPGRVVVQLEDGRQIEFDCLELPGQVAHPGDTLSDLSGQLRLRCLGQLRWELLERGCIRHFSAIPGEKGALRDCGMSRLVRVVRPHELTQELLYDDRARLHEIRIGDRRILSFQWNDEDRISGVWSPVGERLQRHSGFGYDPSGDLIEVTDSSGNLHHYEYINHLLVRESDADGASFYYGYDGSNESARCVRTWGTDGYLDRVLKYDNARVDVTDSYGSVTQYRISPLGLVTAVTDAFGQTTSYRYDQALRLIERQLPDGRRTRDTYDGSGNLVRRHGPGDQIWEMAYDEHGHIIEGTDRVGGKWAYAYDSEGRLVRVRDPLGHTTRLEYQSGRLHKIIDAMGFATHVEVDQYGCPLSLREASGETINFQYDDRGRLAAIDTPDRGRTQWIYDANGRVAAVSSGALAARFVRTAAGSVQRIQRDSGDLTINRDSFGNVLAISLGTRSIRYHRDLEGAVVGLHEPSHPTLTLVRDARGQVIEVRSDGALVLACQRSNVSGKIERLGTATGRVIAVKRDACGRISEMEDSDSGASRFSYRPDGLLIEDSKPTGTRKFDRDLRGAVLRQSCGDFEVESASLDYRGRRLGLDVRGLFGMSYLRDTNGALERVAVTAETGVWDIPAGAAFSHAVIERPPHGSSMSQPDSATTQVAPTSHDNPSATTAAQGHDTTQLWDQDHMLVGDDRWFVHHPDTGALLTSIRNGATEPFNQPRPSRECAQDHQQSLFELYFAVGEIETVLERTCTNPVRTLQKWHGYQTWNPGIRPIPGTHPWDPDQWEIRGLDPSVPPARLDQPTLIGLLGGDFPTQQLRLSEHQ